MSSKLAISLVIGASVGGAIAGIRSLKNSLKIFNDDTKSISKRMVDLGKNAAISLSTIISLGTAVASTTMALAQPAIAFESAMADVKKVVDFKSSAGFKNLSKDILELTRTLPMTAEELAAITASGGQLGVAEQDLKTFTETVAKMSVAFDMSAADSGDAMAKLANVYKIPISQIGNLGDAINELSNSSPAKAADIVNTLGRIGGVAKEFGLTESAAAALSNSFISLGKNPEVAGTAINGMLTKLMTADKGGKKFQAALKDVGISAKQLKANIAKDGQGALTDFLKRLEKLSKEKRMGVLVDLFGLEYADDVSVLAGNVDILEKSLQTLQETDEKGNPKYLGSMEKEFAARSATTENNLKLLKNSFTEIGLTFGSALLPAINSVVNAIKPWMHWVANLISQNPVAVNYLLMFAGGLIGVVGGLVAVKGALSLTLAVILPFWHQGSKLLVLIIKFSPHFLRFATILSGALVKGLILAGKAILFIGRALLMNPIGLLITGIAVAAYLIYQYWEPIKAFFINLWATIKPYFERFCTFVQNLWNNIVGIWEAVWHGITNFFSNLWAEITTAFDGGILGIGTLILNWSPIGLFHKAFAAVLSWFGIDIPNNFSTFASQALQRFTDWVVSWDILGAFKGVFDQVFEWFSNLPSRFAQYGSDIVDGIKNGVSGFADRAKDSVVSFADSVSGWFTKKLEIHSPSRVFRGYGINVVEGLAIGIARTATLATTEVGKVADGMQQSMPKEIASPVINMSRFDTSVSTELVSNTFKKPQKGSELTKDKNIKPKIGSGLATPSYQVIKPVIRNTLPKETPKAIKPVEKGFWDTLWIDLKTGLDKFVSFRKSTAMKPVLNTVETMFKPTLSKEKGFFGSLWDDIQFGANMVGNLLGLNQPTDLRTPSFNPQAKDGGLFADYQPLNRNEVTNTATTHNQGITVHFSPNITITGSAPAPDLKEQLLQALNDPAMLHGLEQLLNRVNDQFGRRAY